MKMRPLRALELVCRLGRATNTMWALLGLSPYILLGFSTFF